MRDTDSTRSRAFQEASAAVDRFLEKFGAQGERLAGAGAGAANRLRAELGRVVDLNLDLVRNAFTMFGTLDGVGGEAGDRLDLPPGRAGSTVGSVVWLHNYDDVERSGVELVGTSLATEDGDLLDAAAWAFEPGRVDVPGRAGAPVVASVAVPGDAVAGVYEGAISALGLDGSPIPVRVEVIALEPVPHDSW